jgi:DMSO reductase family type II enzyme heme b subunit
MSVGTFSLEVPTVTDGVDSLLSADAPAWERAKEVVVAVEPTPLDRQPSAYVQASWRDRPRSAVGQVHVRAAAGSDGLALRLDWTAARPVRRIDDVNAYPDACAVLFPADGREADFGTMGSPEHPVRGWHWRAGSDPPFVVTATGIGTVERIDGQAVREGRAGPGVAGRSCWPDRWAPKGFPSAGDPPFRSRSPCGRARRASAPV